MSGSRDNGTRNRRWWSQAALPAAVVLLALAVRLVVLYQLGGHPLLQPRPGAEGLLDDAAYVRLGARIASGDLAVGPEAFFLPPLYAYFLGLIFFVSGGSITAARVVQVLMGTSAVALVMLTARLWFGRASQLAAGALAACTGLFAFNEILVLQSSLDPFLTALALFALAHAVKSGRPRAFLAAGLAFGALALNRPNALACLAVAVGALLVVPRPAIRLRVRQAAALTVGGLLLIAPVTVRNRVVSGDWVLTTSHGGLNFFIGNGAGATGTWRAVPDVSATIDGQVTDTRRIASVALGHRASAAETSAYFYARAWSDILADPGRWTRVLIRKTALAFSAADASLNFSYVFYVRDESSLLSALAVGPWLLVPLGLFGLVLGARAGLGGGYLVWLAASTGYALTLIAFFVSSRYRLPLLVPMIVGAGFAVERGILRLRAGLTRRDLLVALPLVIAFGLVNWPMSVDDGRTYERTERTVQFFVQGEFEQGERMLAEVERSRPASGSLLLRIGAELQRRGEWDRAVPYLERAVAASPGEGEPRFLLGQSLLHAGRTAEAVPQFEAAQAAGVPSLTLAYDLALAHHALGDDARAREVLRETVLPASSPTDRLVNLARLAIELDEPSVAEGALRLSIARAPEEAVAHELLAMALGMQREDAEAAREAEMAVRLDGGSATARFHLAVAYAGVDRWEEARAELEAALRLDPGLSPALAFRRELDALQAGSSRPKRNGR